MSTKVQKNSGNNKVGGSSGDLSEDDLLKMQEQQNKQTERVTMISNVMAAKHAMLMAIVNNMKS